MRGLSAVLIVTFRSHGQLSKRRRPEAWRRSKSCGPEEPCAVHRRIHQGGATGVRKQCRHCHGLKGVGDGPLAPKNPSPANLTDATWDHGSTDGEIFAVIWNGAPEPKSEMKGMKGTLTEKDVWNIVNFLRSIGPKTAAR